MFAGQVLESSGLGDGTYLPKSVIMRPADISMARQREETHTVLFTCGELLPPLLLLPLLLIIADLVSWEVEQHLSQCVSPAVGQ